MAKVFDRDEFNERYKGMRFGFDAAAPGNQQATVIHWLWDGFDRTLCWRVRADDLTLIEPRTFVGGPMCDACHSRLLAASAVVDETIESLRAAAHIKDGWKIGVKG